MINHLGEAPPAQLRKMILDVSDVDKIKENNPWIGAYDQLKDLTNRQLLYIALAHDYHTPLRTLNVIERKQKAAVLAGYRMEKSGKRLDKNARDVTDGKNDAIEAGIYAYIASLGDQDRETLEAFDTQIQYFREALTERPSGANATERKQENDIRLKITKDLVVLVKLRKELIKELDIKELAGEEEDDTLKQLSTLDRVNMEKIAAMDK